MMHVGRDCLFFAGSYIRSRFLFGMIFTWNWEDTSLFVCSCLLIASTKDKNYAANTSSNDVFVVTRNNTHHISNSQNTAKSHGRESYDMCPKHTFLG